MRKLRGLKGEIIFPMAAKTKVRRWGTSPLSVDGKIGAFCVCLPLSYLINLPRRHLIPDIMAHLSPVFTSGMLSAVRDAGRLPANTPPLPPKGVGAAGTGDSELGGVNFRVEEECMDKTEKEVPPLSRPEEIQVLSRQVNESLSHMKLKERNF